ncbi:MULTISPECIES: sigma-E factor regulatory protein RseB [Brenneria]|uniref:Sigma-E factor regulatory protein RseB n=1 Tax=Brenneria nigrifluens DSM 30175 = ATCC 13028 TaxID=1121120 RepID=A0A2U1UIE3_9GAMM|nr:MULTISPECIES: sigma-E factor regulatory protein RseB [Brenneria]EHD20527.1 sigma E regulatory protein, MucB/RseB [Brenneria sp. EniD312]PWC21401.1 sigma-E factor regulatory protein RseB [Brenneria nigrifluens DSM 30175 = ATCC 13028]QCR03720.1 sigma-E factor regulatory protein RseB [Brenneria nigrifluens DSM 30175 = ATCC 13028]
MKPVWFAVCLLIGSLFYSTIAPAQTASGALLQQMNGASRSLNYEISFINITRQGFESVRYRHAVINNRSLAQLMFMDGPRREIVQRGNEISYFDAGLEPFTLSSDHIVDSLPSLVHADFQKIAQYYDFIPADGRVRIADRLAVGIRIISRDATRYSYAVWMDAESKLPLRVDLQDRNGERLEQFLATALIVDDGVVNALRPLENIRLPPALSAPATENKDFSWSAQWLPLGMKEISRSRRVLPGATLPIETRLYNDGLFSFSINVSPSSEARGEQAVRTGRRSIHTEVRDNNEITVVGELPPATAKRVADNVIFKAQ